MPVSTGIIDTIASPPIASLQQVLDTNGPYGPGSHTIANFHTNGAFLLPAGNYPIAGTYGVLIVCSISPPIGMSRFPGWDDGSSLPTGNADHYAQRICQLIVQHQLPITGAQVTTDERDMFELSMLALWQGVIDAPNRIGIHVAPNVQVELFFMCVL